MFKINAFKMGTLHKHVGFNIETQSSYFKISEEVSHSKLGVHGLDCSE